MNKDLSSKIETILSRDSSFHFDAYEFVLKALNYTQDKMDRDGHVTGQELSEGIKKYALEQYGPMAKTVLTHWGVNSTGDLGRIVYNMIDVGLMKKNEQDSQDDFKDVYDFNQAFNVFKLRNNTAGSNNGQ